MKGDRYGQSDAEKPPAEAPSISRIFSPVGETIRNVVAGERPGIYSPCGKISPLQRTTPRTAPGRTVGTPIETGGPADGVLLFIFNPLIIILQAAFSWIQP